MPRACTGFAAGRAEPADSLDYFPTPPWATRALVAHVLPHRALVGATVWEPACGQGHMVRPLAEAVGPGGRVIASDIWDHGQGAVHDFLDTALPDFLGLVRPVPRPGGRPVDWPVDWIVTNPPFLHFAAFARRALERAAVGVALFGRLAAVEGKDRWRSLYQPHPLTVLAPFCERVPIARGRVIRTGGAPVAYAWLVWRAGAPAGALWPIPPCKAALERAEDYADPAGPAGQGSAGQGGGMADRAAPSPRRQGLLALEGAPS